MATATQIAGQENYLNTEYGIKSWLLTKDHKRIALLYLVTITLFFFLGGLFAMLIRLELLTPGTGGELVTPDIYNRLFTMHGIVMIFLFLIPSIPAVLGNFLVPLMVGARDLAFPRLNLFSWYLLVGGGGLILYSIITGGADTGWTFYTPFSTQFANTPVIAAALGIFVAGFSSILTGLNFVVTIHRMRAPGLTWSRMPLFLWSIYATSVIQILGTPVLAVTLALVFLERAFQIGVFNPQLGGDPLLFQHLFWFYSHPAVYIMILPSMGVISEVIPCFARKRIFGYSFVAMSSVAIAVFGFLVWAHHMFVAGISLYAALIFSLLSYSVAVPSAVKVFNWTATLYKGSIHLRTPMLYALGFAGHRRPRNRHLLCGGPLPLHHGGRGGHGIPRRDSFLVAQDHRQNVSGNLGAHCRRPDLSGVQPDLLSAVCDGLCGGAAPLPYLCSRIPGVERFLHGRRLDSGGRLPSAPALFAVVVALWQGRRAQSLECCGAGVDDSVPAPSPEFRRNSGSDLGSLQLRRIARNAGGGRSWRRCTLTPMPWPAVWRPRFTSRRCNTISPIWNSSANRRPWACGSS